MMKLTAADKSDVGKQRDQNEDCAYKRVESFEDGDHGLFIVADGMGAIRLARLPVGLLSIRSAEPWIVSSSRLPINPRSSCLLPRLIPMRR